MAESTMRPPSPPKNSELNPPCVDASDARPAKDTRPAPSSALPVPRYCFSRCPNVYVAVRTATLFVAAFQNFTSA